MDADKMAAMIKVFHDAPELDAMVGQPFCWDDGHAELVIDGRYSKSYLYTELEKVFKEKG